MITGFENQVLFTDLVSGVIDIGTTAATCGLTGAGVVTFRAASANSGTVTIGKSDVSTLAGFTLVAGQQSPPIALTDMSILWCDASAASQKLEYLIQR